MRRLWEAVDTRVSRLIRVRYASYIKPRNLRQGKSVELEYPEVKEICQLVGLKCDPPKPKRLSGKARKNQYTGSGKRTIKRKSPGTDPRRRRRR